MTALRLRNVEASYGAARALYGISLNVEPGTIVALLGANGAGKSTILKTLSGLLRPTAGDIEFDGHRLNSLSPREIIRLGIAQVPEGRKIFKDLNVGENLKMGAYSRSDRAGIAQDQEMVFDLFPVLKERVKQLGGSLSGGEQQMLTIGRGLMARPRLLLLDEPSLGLAPLIVRDIFGVLKKINADQGTTLLIVEQNVHVALQNADYAYVLQLGRVTVEGTAGELQENREVVASYLGTQDRAAAGRRVGGPEG